MLYAKSLTACRTPRACTRATRGQGEHRSAQHLPFIDVGYANWVVAGTAQIVTVVLVVLGWVLATAVITAFAGVLRRGD